MEDFLDHVLAKHPIFDFLTLQSSWYGRTPLGPGKSLGDRRNFWPMLLGVRFFENVFLAEGRSK